MSRHQVDISVWSDAPRMDIGAPMPAISCRDSQLLVAYRVGGPPQTGRDAFAVVCFDGVLQHTFGYPNDEALGGHPLYGVGLTFYAFNEIRNSPTVEELGRRNARALPGYGDPLGTARHWVVSFHDETLEVIGRSVTFVGVREAASAAEALRMHAA